MHIECPSKSRRHRVIHNTYYPDHTAGPQQVERKVLRRQTGVVQVRREFSRRRYERLVSIQSKHTIHSMKCITFQPIDKYGMDWLFNHQPEHTMIDAVPHQ